MKSLSIIVAAFNEEASIGTALREILAAFGGMGSRLEILVFDDHSSDRTGFFAMEAAKGDSRIRVIRNSANLNIGGVYKAGIRMASKEYLLLLPGDNEVDVLQVARGLDHLGGEDIAVAFPEKAAVRPIIRRILSKIYIHLVNGLFGTVFAYTNGSNYVRTARLKDLRIGTDGFAYQTEVLVRLVLAGSDYVEFGVQLRGRKGGGSTALRPRNWAGVFWALARLFRELRLGPGSPLGRRGRRLARFDSAGAPLPAGPCRGARGDRLLSAAMATALLLAGGWAGGVWSQIRATRLQAEADRNGADAGDVLFPIAHCTIGSEPGRIYADRLDAAAALWKRKPRPIWLLAGRHPGMPASGADLGRRYLVRHGVNGESIIVLGVLGEFSHSSDTTEESSIAAALARQRGAKPVILGEILHLSQASLVVGAYGLVPVLHAVSPSAPYGMRYTFTRLAALAVTWVDRKGHSFFWLRWLRRGFSENFRAAAGLPGGCLPAGSLR